MKVEVSCPTNIWPRSSATSYPPSAIQGTENRAGSNVNRVEVPLAQMFGYATDLRSRTQGRATFTMHFSHYAETPPNISEEVIKRIKADAGAK